MARLEAFLAAAYIFGPALGGFLGNIKLNIPFIAAGVVAGITLVVAYFYLEESLDLNAVKSTLKKKKKRDFKKMFPSVVVGLLYDL